MEIFVERADDVRAVLADSRFVPVPPGPGGPVGSMAWLRSAVARFSHGPEHARRRALVEAELAAIAPERLGAAAAGSGRPAGEVAVAVLADALGATGVDAVVAAMPAVAAVYHGSVADGLREAPPVRSTRRVATVDSGVGGTGVAAGDTLVLDRAAAGLPFGGEPRVCPGRAHALAIAAGAVSAARPAL